VNVQRVVRAGLVGLLLCSPGAAAKTHNSDTPNLETQGLSHDKIAVSILSGFFVITKGQIGGLSQKQNFVIDTGTAPSILNSRLAKRMGLDVKAGVLVAVGRPLNTGQTILPELQLGPIAVRDLPMNVMDLSFLENALKMDIAGMIGMDVLSQTSFRLDYDRKELQFGSVSKVGIPVRYDGLSRLALAVATLQGRLVRLIVDTGSDLVVVYGRSWELDSTNHVSRMQAGTSVGEQVPARQIPNAEMVLGGKQFRGLRTYSVPSAHGSGYDGFIGVTALKLHAISFDRDTQTMYLLN
jgi:predicted aspartyl protease